MKIGGEKIPKNLTEFDHMADSFIFAGLFFPPYKAFQEIHDISGTVCNKILKLSNEKGLRLLFRKH